MKTNTSSKLNITKLKFHQNWYVTKTEMSPNLNCHQNWSVIKTAMLPKLKCYQTLKCPQKSKSKFKRSVLNTLVLFSLHLRTKPGDSVMCHKTPRCLECDVGHAEMLGGWWEEARCATRKVNILTTEKCGDVVILTPCITYSTYYCYNKLKYLPSRHF